MDKVNFKKKFGQNFLTNKGIITNIVSSVDILDNNLVIEVGPGAGALTEELAKKFDNVLAYEIDTELIDILKETFKNNKNVDFIFDDFLNRNIYDDIKKYNVDNIYFIANLPYYITTPIITKLIESGININNIVIMVQKEVADRFSAKVGTRDYNSLTVFLNYYFEIKKLFNVGRNNFIPAPNVDSAVVKMTRKEDLLFLKDRNFFFKLIRDSFQFKRKNIRNNLKNYDLDIIEKTLHKYNLDLNIRAEQISLEIFVDLANNLIN